MMRIFFLALFLFPLSLTAAETLTLSKDGKTDYTIVLSDAATPVEQTAAKELKQHLDAVTGVAFPISKESESGTGPKIFVVKKDFDVSKIPYDGIVIKTVGKDLILTGHPRRGPLYAVNTFLEDAVGVRWWTSTESFVPKKPTLEIPEQNIEYAPKLVYRKTSYFDAKKSEAFMARMKGNSNWANNTPEYGGYLSFLPGTVHSFDTFLPPKKYFEGRPEWFSEIDGQRTAVNAQICLTNEAMRKEFTKNVLEALRKKSDVDYVNIGQNDNQRYCRCKNCTVAAEKEGSQAGPLLEFVNLIAEAVEKEFPEVRIVTLAYQYTRTPPREIRPRKNVIIYLCSIECSFVQPIGEGEQNAKFRDDIAAWNRITEKLFVWDYTVNFGAYIVPHPNLRVLGPNVRFFVRQGAVGLNEQGDWFCSAGHLARLKQWVFSRLMWNPALDAERLIDEFLNGYYGPDAGPLMREYIDTICDRAERSGVYLGCFMGERLNWLDLDTLNKSIELFHRALAAAKDEALRERIDREKLSVDLALLLNYRNFHRQAKMLGKPFVGPKNPQTAVDDFLARCKRYGVNRFKETDTASDFKALEISLRNRFAAETEAPVPEFCRNLPDGSWIDLQENDLTIRSPGKLEFHVDDKQASNGRAIKMSGEHHEWGFRFYFDSAFLEMKPFKSGESDGKPTYRIWVAARCDATATSGRAMTFGIYDIAQKKGVRHKTATVDGIGGTDYRWIDMGTLEMNPNLMFWAAPPKRSGEVGAVYLDRIVVVRER